MKYGHEFQPLKKPLLQRLGPLTMLRRLSQSNETQAPAPAASLPWPIRLLLVAMGAGMLTLLVIAARLKPDPYGQGYGTHQQLGLPPCTFITLFGVRCPSCGMTTAWTHVVRGQIPSALRSNTGGTLLALLALAATPWSIVCGMRGCWLGGGLTDRTIVSLAACVIGVTLLDWLIRLTFSR